VARSCVGWKEVEKGFRSLGGLVSRGGSEGVFKSQENVSHVRYREQALSEHETDSRQVPLASPPHFSFSNPNLYDGTGDGRGLQKRLTFSDHGTKLTLPAPFCALFAKVWSSLRLLSVVATTAPCGQQQLDRWSTETVYYSTSGGGM
jgi:hypothetical protein